MQAIVCAEFFDDARGLYFEMIRTAYGGGVAVPYHIPHYTVLYCTNMAETGRLDVTENGDVERGPIALVRAPAPHTLAAPHAPPGP